MAIDYEVREGDPFERARDRVDAFVEETFSWRGALRLHRHTLGWDLLRAPVNVALAPVHLLVRIFAAVLDLLRLRRAAAGLNSFLASIVLPTATGRHIEHKVAADFLRLPQLKASEPGSPADLALKTYSATRSAVSEITTAVIAILIGALIFRSLTPGVVSMAPTVADALVRDRAIGSFWLGENLGSAWYGIFQPGASVSQIGWTVAVLLMAASLVTAFAGLLADPIQARLGIHRRRLLRLVDAIESDMAGRPSRSFAARELYYARFTDIFDAVAALSRHLR
ncbi:DUF6635 family protein [Citreimonas salinaria]|uniref:Uncharacterized protein n=1 Tax=Citreimonas salinaria TaxID=321339 RepID=A0A1H3M2H0_9RHOB|nr:DUF6635 family protein [Citreimonas salinaria]SDY70215.1 hypothetical protein SAMN05444340_11540 [Citreimonas salinaria]